MATQIRNQRGRRSAAGCSIPVDLLDPRLFKALGDPARISLICHLAKCRVPRTVNDIAACCPTDVSVVSRHLSLLRAAGILSAERRGREVYYTIDCCAVAEKLGKLAEAMSVCCPKAVSSRPYKRPSTKHKEKRR